MKKVLRFVLVIIAIFLTSEYAFSQVTVTPLNSKNCGAPFTVNFTSNAPGGSHYSWDFGDGNTDTLQNPSHTYTQLGYFYVYLTVYDITYTYIGSAYAYVDVQNPNFPGYMSFYPSPKYACPGSSINLKTDYGYASYVWSYGDGSPIDSTFYESTNHTYQSIGHYPISVHIYNSCGRDTILRDSVIIDNNSVAANASFFASDTIACPNTQISFNPDYMMNNLTSYHWDFGDPASGANNTSTYSYSNHAFASLGTYTVTLTGTNACGNTDTVRHVITIDKSKSSFPSYMYFSINPKSACPGSNINFYADYGYASYVWNYGDGSPLDSVNFNNANHTYNTVGNYPVSVHIYNYCGGDTILRDSVIIDNSMLANASFYASDTIACPNTQISFSSDYMNNLTSYHWDFGDPASGANNTSTYSYPNHAFASLGTYTVTLTGTNACGNTDTVRHVITIDKSKSSFPSYMYFSINPKPACPGSNINFYADYGYAAYVWNYGDGSPIDSVNFNNTNHIYNAVGNYPVSVHIYNNCGGDTILRDSVIIDKSMLANASFYASSTVACPNTQISFNPDYMNNLTSYQWDFGDPASGVNNTSTYSYPSHAFASLGTYTVTLTGTNDCGNTDTIRHIITIDKSNSSFPNWTKLNVYPKPACPGSNINFNADYGYAAYVWNYGDGSPVDSVNFNNANHTYNAVGNYPVSVHIYNNCGGDTILRDSVIIDKSMLANASFYASSTVACPNTQISFNPDYMNNLTSYQWDFGDPASGVNNTSTYSYPSHAFASLGTYTVTLTGTNGCGNTDTVRHIITIDKSNSSFPNWTKLNVYPKPACPGSNINFNADYGYAAYVWNYGDGSPVDSVNFNNANHTYNAVGNYPVSVHIYNNCGGDTILRDSVIINNNVGIPNWISMNSDTLMGCPGDRVSIDAPWGFASYVWNYGDGSAVDSTNNNYQNHLYTSTGIYSVSVRIYNNCGKDTILYTTVKIGNNVGFSKNVYMNMSSAQGCPGDKVQFGASDGYSSYVWNYGDGSPIDSSAMPYKEHIYQNVGTYSISVKIRNNCGMDTVLFNTVAIGTNADFPNWMNVSVNNNPICPGGEAQFNVNSGYKSYQWNFGDGTIVIDSPWPSHRYDSIGNYNVSVRVTNSCGTDTILNTVVNVQNNAGFPSWMSLNAGPGGCPGDMVTFETDGGYVSYFWDFGKGDTVTTFDSRINHKYDSVGTYFASVKVKNACGNFITLSTSVSINANSPIGNVVLAPVAPTCPNDKVFLQSYEVTNNGGSLTSYTSMWDFGDGSKDTTFLGNGIYHTYADTGIYTVTVTLRNACGNTKTITGSVEVKDNTVPMLDKNMFGIAGQSAIAGCAGDQILFYSGGIGINTWDFGDGVTATATDTVTVEQGSLASIINHTYADTGSYNVKLTLTNKCGNSVTDSMIVQIKNGTQVNGELFIEAPLDTNGYVIYKPVNMFALGGNKCFWEFGNGDTLSTTVSSTSHVYTVAGTYTVKVTVTNGCGNSASYSQVIKINTPKGFSAFIADVKKVTCNGGSNGSATVAQLGGIAPYTYSWSTTPAQTSATATGLSSGTYTVTVTDSIGGIATTSAVIPQSPLLTANLSVVKPITCNGAKNGSVSVAPQGGTGPYTFSWNTATTQTTAMISGLDTGMYAVTVTDSMGCTVTGNIILKQPSLLTANPSVVKLITCNGAKNGSVSVAPQGGIGPYTFSWNTATTQTTAMISGLDTGMYTVTVKDSMGCATTRSIGLQQPSLLTANLSVVKPITCNGAKNGSVAVAPQGGIGSYTFSWNGMTQTTAMISGLDTGMYTVTVKDLMGCATTRSIGLQQPSLLTANLSVVKPITCNGAKNGSVAVMPAGGLGSYTFSWNTGATQTTAVISGLDTGAYTVTVKDSAGCATTKSINLNQPSLLTATISTTINTCNGDSNGTATVKPTGGTGPYAFSWNTNPIQTTATAKGLAAGSYSVSITDSMGCTTTKATAITEPMAITLTVSATSATCGNANGGATASASGGTAPYTYLWSNNVTGASITNVGFGSYTVTATSADGCTQSSIVAISEQSAFTVSDSSKNVTCNGGSDGSIKINVSGATGTPTYTWSDGSSTQSRTGLKAGNYSVTIKDGACSAVKSITITEPDAIILSTTQTDIKCNGDVNGSVNLTVKGGVAPYSYLWNNKATTEDISGLKAGTYSVTVTDANACTKTTSVTISEPTVIALTTSKTDVTCNGAGNGSINLTVNGGAAPYSYLWDNGSTTEDLSGLSLGTYSVSVTDANSCSTTASVIINEPFLLKASITSKTDISCNGAGNGSINLTVTGGTSPYTYAWSNAATTEDLSGLKAGTYSVTVKDANACTVTSASATITEPTAVSLSTTKTNASCNGSSNGSIDLTVNGGAAPYTYLWSNTATTEDVSGLKAATYKVSVTDANACTSNDSVVITEPSVVVASTTVLANVTCNAGSDGSVSVSATGGDGSYTYAWASGATTATRTALKAGTYNVTVTDGSGCVGTASVTVTQPAAMDITVTTTSSSCGKSDGSATVSTVNGGTSPYTYSWNSATTQTTQTATALIAKTYEVTVTDAKSCVVKKSVAVSDKNAPALSSTSTNITCNGSADGKISLTTTGGTPPLTYQWSNGKTTSSVSGLSSGTYDATVTDANGCVANESVTITEPDALFATAVTVKNVTCKSGANASATVSVSGGTLPYTYSWNTVPAQSTDTATGLAAGTYVVTVTDANNCSVTDSVKITQPVGMTATVTTIKNATCSDKSDGSVTVASVLGGTLPYSYSWNTTPAQTTQTATALKGGNYTATITDGMGCSTTASVSVSQPAAITFNNILTNVKCNGNANGAIKAAVSGGTAPYHYSWSNNKMDTAITGLTAGTYTLTVTDSVGCTAIATESITEPAAIVVTDTATAANCRNTDGSAAVVNVTGGAPPYTYMWSNGSTDKLATNLGSGVYTVKVTGANGCTKSSEIVITEKNTTFTLTLDSIKNVSCNKNADGAVYTSVTGGGVYKYSWSNGSITEDISNLKAGTYVVTIQDTTTLCRIVKSINVSEPSAITLATTITQSSCSTPDGTASVSASGGKAPYTYSWSTTPVQTTQKASGLGADIYNVTVTDASGCTAKEVASVSTFNAPDVAITAKNASCNGKSDGALTVKVTGGAAPYQQFWSGPGLTNFGVGANKSFPALGAGLFSYQVTDQNGCSSSGSVSLTQPDALHLEIVSSDENCDVANGRAMASPSGGTAPYTYLWQNNTTNATASGLAKGIYTVVVKDSMGCIATDSAKVGRSAASQSLCLITVDESTGKNVLVWEKTPGLKTEAYHIYREGSKAGVFEEIGSVPYDSLSIFVDTNSNPKARAYRYKISTYDSCSEESAIITTAHNKTMHLAANYGVPKPAINLEWENYEGMIFETYRIWRGTTPQDMSVIDSVPSNIYSYTDLTPPLNTDSLYYALEVVSSLTCEATHKTGNNYNSAKSNTASISAPAAPDSTSSIAEETNNSKLLVYPNPNQGMFTLSIPLKGKQDVTIRVFSMQGQLVVEQRISDFAGGTLTKELDLSNYSKGIYHVQVSTQRGVFNQKVGIQ